MLPRVLCLVLAFFGALGGSGGLLGQQSAPLPKAEQLHLVIRFFEEERGFNGNVLVAQEGRIVYENAVGWENVEKGDALTLESPFYLASVSKTFTAASIMMLSERRMLHYDELISAFFPELGSVGSKITIRHLLNHTSGLPDYFKMGWDSPGLTSAQLYNRLVSQRIVLKSKPGNKYSYNNTGYVLLALIVESITGMPYYQFVQKNITEPLDMTNTWVYDLRNVGKMGRPVVIGYDPPMKKRQDYYLLTYGDGGMYSTLTDLFKWDRAISNYTLVSKENLEAAFEPVTLASGRESNYGFGWVIGSNLNGKTISHSGGLAGFRTYFEKQLEVGTTVIILTNNSNEDLFAVRNLFVKIMDGRPYELPDPR